MAHEAGIHVAFKGEDEGTLKGLRLLAKTRNTRTLNSISSLNLYEPNR